MLIRDVLMAIRGGDDADIVEVRHLDATASDADQGNFEERCEYLGVLDFQSEVNELGIVLKGGTWH